MKTRFSTTDPLASTALRAALVSCGLVLVVAMVAAGVRLLPWVLDPTIAWATLAPFARSLGAVAVEAAVLTGWPVGWAIAAQRLVDRGEARVLASLGESPGQTVLRLGPQAAAFALVLAATSGVLGREASAPGRVVNALLTEGHEACTVAASPTTYGVPFVSATWLCAPPSTRLVGRAPIGDVAFSAKDARVSDDLRRIDLDDARLALPTHIEQAPAIHVHVATLTLRGLAPWARASGIPPVLRAIVITASGLASSCGAVLALVVLAARERRARSRGGARSDSARTTGVVAAVALGAAGPLSALATLRAIEVRLPDGVASSRWLASLATVPLAAGLAVVLAALLVLALPGPRRAGTQ